MGDIHHTMNVLFHGIGTPGRELDPGEDGYWIDKTTFLDILDDLAAMPHVQLSFDDGNTSDLTIVLPALLERGLTATFFVLAGRLDTPGCIDADGVRELGRHGMAIGIHGMHHRRWRRLDLRTSHEELVEAQQQLADVTRTAVSQAACPFGQYDRRALRELNRLGYTKVFTSDRRPARPGAWLQPRFSVLRGDTPQSLKAQLTASTTLPRRVRGVVVGAVKRWR